MEDNEARESVREVLLAETFRPSSLACAPTVALRPSRAGGGGAFMGRLLPALLGRATGALWLMYGDRLAPLGAGLARADAEGDGDGNSLDGSDGG